jgi:uncharacterized protein YjiS (DUF1127 family)
MEGTMSDRTFTNHVLPSPWTWLARGTHGAARPARFTRAAAWFGSRDFGGTPCPGAPPRPGLRAMLRSAWHRHRTRRSLAELNAYLLKDIGVTYAEAEAEANKPFWMM